MTEENKIIYILMKLRQIHVLIEGVILLEHEYLASLC